MDKQTLHDTAQNYLSQRHVGPESLTQLLQMIYNSGYQNGVLDERFGDWGKMPIKEMSREELKGLYPEEKSIEVEVKIERADNNSPQESAYSPTLNEYTPNPVRS